MTTALRSFDCTGNCVQGRECDCGPTQSPPCGLSMLHCLRLRLRLAWLRFRIARIAYPEFEGDPSHIAILAVEADIKAVIHAMNNDISHTKATP